MKTDNAFIIFTVFQRMKLYIMHKLYNGLIIYIQFTLAGKAKQTFANFPSNFYPNLTKI
jgi:hypothetical protein